jgi:hypothetical protein
MTMKKVVARRRRSELPTALVLMNIATSPILLGGIKVR